MKKLLALLTMVVFGLFTFSLADDVDPVEEEVVVEEVVEEEEVEETEETEEVVELVAPELWTDLGGSHSQKEEKYSVDFSLKTLANDYLGEKVVVLINLPEGMEFVDDDGNIYQGEMETRQYPLADYDLHFVANFATWGNYDFSLTLVNLEGEEIAHYSDSFELIRIKVYSGGGGWTVDPVDPVEPEINPDFELAKIILEDQLDLANELAEIIPTKDQRIQKVVRNLLLKFKESDNQNTRAIGVYIYHLAFVL